MSDVRRHRITEAGPVHDEREIDAVVEVLRSGTLQLGPNVEEFERRGAELLAQQHGVMVNSGTSACWLAVDLLGCEPGDEVITSPLTFSSDIAPLVRNGIIPAFVDVEPDTLPDRRHEDRGDDRAAHQSDPDAEPGGQLPRLGRDPRHRRSPRPPRRRRQLRRARLVPARHAHRPARRHLGDELRAWALDHRGGQRRHDRGRRPGLVRPDARTSPLGPTLREVPVRQQAGRRRPLRRARRRHAVRHGLRVRRHGLQLRAVGDHGRVRPRAVGQARRLQRPAPTQLRTARRSARQTRGQSDAAAHDAGARDHVDALPVRARRRHRPHRDAGVLPRARDAHADGLDRQHPPPARVLAHRAPRPGRRPAERRPGDGPGTLAALAQRAHQRRQSATSSSRCRTACTRSHSAFSERLALPSASTRRCTMADSREPTDTYEAPCIAERTKLDLPLIGFQSNQPPPP